ncbi:hypothetical protein [Bradyrhizobium sp. CCBAU 53415]|uniref:hypothetical protein n=1 Tax=Bradyrhizobium sp. CCBAU 53415 TaxID=1325119 RepID=UPI003FA4A8F4
MSKKTLYKLFESKTELFRAMLLRSLPPVHFADAPIEGPPSARCDTPFGRLRTWRWPPARSHCIA